MNDSHGDAQPVSSLPRRPGQAIASGALLALWILFLAAMALAG